VPLYLEIFEFQFHNNVTASWWLIGETVAVAY